MSISKTKALQLTQAGNFNQFRVSKLTGSVRERAEFDPQRRQEVKAVRKMRACLRCSLLKIKVGCWSSGPELVSNTSSARAIILVQLANNFLLCCMAPTRNRHCHSQGALGQGFMKLVSLKPVSNP
jgi:hypothetical protein